MRSSIVLTRIVPFFIIILLAVHTAAVPPLPAEFYGSILLDGNPAPAGTVITAQINGVDRGSITTDIPGFYGGPGLFDTRLKVNVTEEEYRPGEMKIVFTINGQRASIETDFEAGSSRQLDLSTGGGIALSQPTGTVTPMVTFPAQMAEPMVTGSSSDSSDSGSSTITYGLDQPRIFKSDDGLAELSFAKDTMLFSPEGQFLNVVGLRSRSISDIPPMPANQSLRFSGYIYEIIPSGTYFNPSGVLSLKLPPDRAYEIINSGPVIYEYLSQTAAWEPVSTTSNVFTGSITADVFEAAIYGLFTPIAVGQQNLNNQSNNDNSFIIAGNQTANVSPPLPVGFEQMSSMPEITPQAIITPQNIITPLPTEFSPSVMVTENPITPVPTPSEVNIDSGRSKIPGLGLIQSLGSAIKTRMSGPILAATGILILLILINAAVYAIYRYWWMKRERNG